jgi:hypothetical protein
MFNNLLSGPLPSNGPGIVDAGACFGYVFTSRCLAMDAFSVSAIPAFSHHVTIF